MARNQARRQKKLMKKRQKDKQRKKSVALSPPYAMLSPRKKISQAAGLPIHECLINPSWRDLGMATIVLARRQPDGHLVVGLFLVDILCLGLKDTFCNVDVSASGYRTEFTPSVFNEPPQACPPALAHQIIYGAIAFARRFGFDPHRDFDLTRHLLDPPDRYEPVDNIEFGQGGRPMYVQGPNDDVQRILRKLEAGAGSGNYDFMSAVEAF
jgi:hypothetical protein